MILIFIPLICSLFSQPISVIFLSLLPFLILKIKNNCVQSYYTTRTAPRVVRSTKLSPVLWDSYLDGWPKTNTPCGNNFFFSFPFEGDIKDCRTPQPCVMSLLLFLNYLYNRTNKQPDPSFEFFSILFTFGRLNNSLDLIAICSSVKTLLSPLQSTLWHPALNSSCLFRSASPQIIP